MASDFSIGQFRFLERLLVVHGHWCHKRIALMVNSLSHICKINPLNTFFYSNLIKMLTNVYNWCVGCIQLVILIFVASTKNNIFAIAC